jgi:hypothetical protein
VHGDLHADGQQCRMGRPLDQLLLHLALLAQQPLLEQGRRITRAQGKGNDYVSA